MLFLTLISAVLAQTPGDSRWLVEETAMKRFADGEEISATIKADTKVEIIAIGDVLVRVRAGRDMGWIAPTVLSETKPASD
jgi:hypothetical protein